MNTRHPSRSHHLDDRAENPVMLVVCVVLASFILGLIPIAISNNLNTSNPNTTPLTLGEAGLWNALGR